MSLWLGLSPSEATAQNSGHIRLFTLDKSYKPGKAVTVFAYFFRVPPSMSLFGGGLAQSIRHSPDFQLKRRARITSFNEQVRDNQGYPIGTRQHAMFRLRMVPRKEGAVLTYGPIQYKGITSNILRFPKYASSSSNEQIRTEIRIPKGEVLRQGQGFRVNIILRCPRTLCDYSQINQRDLLRHMRRKTRVLGGEGLWQDSHNVTPQLNYVQDNPPMTELTFAYRFVALRQGKLQVPGIIATLPIIETIDQDKALIEIRQWLVQKMKFPANNAAQYVRFRRSKLALIAFQKVTVPPKLVEIQPSMGVQGTWKLRSRWAMHPTTRKPLWQVSLQGNGFLLLADQALRETLRKFLKTTGLEKTAKLAHYTWAMPDQTISGRGAIHMYFSFSGKRPKIPALSMKFLGSQGTSTAQTTPTLEPDGRLVPLQENFQHPKSTRHIYVYYDQAPNPQQDQVVDVWTFRLARSFPLQQALARHWSLKTPLGLQAETKFKDFTQRSQRQGGFGSFFQISTQRVQIPVHTARVQVRQKDDLLARFPSVKWGGQWISMHKETGRGLSMQAQVDRTRYFVGESIEYKLTLRCPSTDCPQKAKGFYAQHFRANLKLPKFERFSGWRQLENFTRRQDDKGRTTFTYRVRFKAPQIGNLELKAATLRLPSRLLRELNQKHQICFFRSGRSEGLLLSSIARDHYRQQDQESCSLGTQELTTPTLSIPIETLPNDAQSAKLIGSFRLNARFSQLSYPNKQATEVDKPFYLVVDIAGNGDIESARDLLRDQLAEVARTLRKESITADLELVKDKDLQRRGIARIQVQLIGEQEGTFTIPSLKLQHYQRNEGLLTAQTLPLKVKIESRAGSRVAVVKRPTAPADTAPARQFQQDTDLRPNRIVGAQLLANEHFVLQHWSHFLWLFSSPLAFLFFLGWHRSDRRRQEDPTLQKQQKAIKSFRSELNQVQTDSDSPWEKQVLQVTQRFVTSRLGLQRRQMTASEAREELTSHLAGDTLPTCATSLLQQWEQLEGSLYGADPIADKAVFTKQLEQNIRELHRLLPTPKTS